MRCSAAPKKTRYSTHEAANDAARLVRRAHRIVIRSYECDACAGYHLTSKQKR